MEIKEIINIKEFPWTPKQIKFINLALSKECKMMFVNGPAGVSKTLLGTYVGLKLLNDRKISDIIYVRSVIESGSKSLGYLPGSEIDKFAPFLAPLEDKLSELLKLSDIQKLKNDNRIHALPINFVRGLQFNAQMVLGDEIQNFEPKEIITLITRFGKFCKMILCGDTKQSDINGRSGFKRIFDLFDDEESKQNGIYTFEFTTEDVMRSEEVKFILNKLDTLANKVAI